MIDIKYENLSELIGILREKEVFLYEEDGKLKYRQNNFKMNKDIIEILLKNKEEIIDILKLERKSHNLVNNNISEFPLTDIQSAYLFGKEDMYEYGNVSCHMCMSLIYPRLDKNRVEEIWNYLIKRHEMLRVVFKSSGSQHIIKNIPYFKLYNAESKNDIVNSLYDKTYTSNKWPLFDIACFDNDDDNKSELLLSFDMMIADWRSIWILINEFETIYFNKGKLLNNEYRFSDYIEAEVRRKKFPKYYADKYYWTSKIDEIIAAPQIKIVNDAGCKTKSKFNRYSYFLKKENWVKIKSIEKTVGVTSSCTLMALYAYTIAKYSENKKFALNCTVMDRDRYSDKLENLVGDFTNILLLGVDFENETTFLNHAKNLQLKLIKGIEHSSFSGIEVLREIRKQERTRNNIYPYVFTSSIGFNSDSKEYIGQYTGKGISQTPQVFIDCQVVDFDGDLYINWDVREGVFKDSFIKEMFSSFVNMLAELEEIENWRKIINIETLNLSDKLIDEAEIDTVRLLNSNESNLYFDVKDDIYLKIKEILINVWTILLSKNINDNSDIFTEGADSLLIAQASSRIVKDFSKINSEIEISFDSLMRIMIEKSNITNMAKEIFIKIFNTNDNRKNNEDNSRSLGKIKFFRKSQSKDLIVIVHSGLGNVSKIDNFITNISSYTGQDIVAIEINDMKKYINISAENLFETVGREYFYLIKDYGYRNIQLIGHCIGGMIACETARELVKNNFNVIDISLIDSTPATNQYKQELITELLFIKMLGMNFIDISIIDFNEETLNEYLSFTANTSTNIKIENSIKKMSKISKAERFKKYFHHWIEEDEELFLLYEVFKKNSIAASHKISPVISDIRLFIASGINEVIPKEMNKITEFWENVCIGDFDIIKINGNHNSCIEDKKNSEILAKKISEKWCEGVGDCSHVER